MTYKYAPLNQNHLPQLIALLDTVFGIQNKDKEALVTWKYYHPFFKKHAFQYGAFVDNQLISHYANVPIEIENKHTIFKGAICTDMGTHPLHRGKGLISVLSKLLYKNVEKKGFKVSIGFSNEAGIQVDRYSKSYGYQIVGNFQSYYHILTRKKSTSCKLVRVASFELEISHMDTNEYLSIHKTTDYLNWRYKDNPNNEYIFYNILKEGKFIGYVILKNSKIRTHVIDIVTKDTSIYVMKCIVNAINNTALEYKKRFITYCILDNSFWHNVFNRTLSLKKNSKKNKFYLTVKLHDISMKEASRILSKDNWLCFVGDIL